MALSERLSSEPRQIVIIGGGVIGISSAYFLTRHRLYDPKIHSITVLEAGKIADGSSGKGGDFIAEWATPTALAPLSFQLHNELAARHDGGRIWGHRNVYGAEIKLLAQKPQSMSFKNATRSEEVEFPPGLDWLRPGSIQEYNEIGTPSNSGQVNPFNFTSTLAKLAEDSGAKVKVQSAASAINLDEDHKKVKSVTYVEDGKSKSIDATDVLVAAGAWSPMFVPGLQLLASMGHSTIIRPTRLLSPYILFPTIKAAPDADLKTLISPDIYPRPSDELYNFDTVYSSGPDGYDDPLPLGTGSVKIEEARINDVLTAETSVSREICDGNIVAKQACFKPQFRKHGEGDEVGPIIGPVDGVKGLWLATGHDEWGIQNAPGTGLILSEMIFDGKATSANAERLDPKHFLGK